MSPTKAKHPSTQRCELCTSRHRGICAFLDQGSLEDISRKSLVVDIPSKQLLRDPHKPSEYVNILLSGIAKASSRLPNGQEQILYFLHRNQMWNLTLSVDKMHDMDGPFIESIGPVKICRIPTVLLEKAAKTHPHLNAYQEKTIAKRLFHLRKHVVLLGKKTATERVAAFLLETYHQQQPTVKGSSVNGKVCIHIPVSRTDIADYLGLSLETVSRTFAALRKKNLIDCKSKHEVWADLVALDEIYS